MICRKCGFEYPQSDRRCPKCGYSASSGQKPPVRMRSGYHEGTRPGAGRTGESQNYTPPVRRPMPGRKKDFRWYLIALVSFFCVLTAFLPLVSIYSKTLAAKTEWDLRGVYVQAGRLDQLLENETFRAVTDEDGFIGDMVGKVSGFDTAEVKRRIGDLRTGLYAMCGLILAAVTVNLLCGIICLTPPEMLKTIMVMITCLVDIGTAVMVRVICMLQAKEVEPLAGAISSLEKMLGSDASILAAFTEMKPGIACMVLLVASMFSAVTVLMMRAQRAG